MTDLTNADAVKWLSEQSCEKGHGTARCPTVCDADGEVCFASGACYPCYAALDVHEGRRSSNMLIEIARLRYRVWELEARKERYGLDGNRGRIGVGRKFA